MINYSAIDPDFPGEKLLAGLRAVEARYGIHLTLHDCRGLLCHANGRPFFPDRCMHMHPYCITGRFEMPGWNRRCHEECKLRVEANADRLRRPFLHHCWKGVTELVVPLERNGLPVLLLYAGVFRTSGAELPEDLTPELRARFETLPPPDEKLGENLALELQLIGQGMLHYAGLSRNRAGFPQERSNQIRRFLEDHAHEDIALSDLAAAMHLSTTHCCHVVKYHFGQPFHTLLRQERIRRARNLLYSTEMPLKEIAAAVGFHNEFYFNREFSRVCGIPPGECRKRENRILAAGRKSPALNRNRLRSSETGTEPDL